MQLKDDCFAFGGGLIALDDAVTAFTERLSAVVGTETVAVGEALGRVLAEDVVSDRDVPPHNNSAVDGYAVHFDDLDPDGVTRLPVTGRVAAGHPLERAAVRGEAIRIFTGAPVPDGTDGGPDTVFMEEDCELDGDAVLLPKGIRKGSNFRRRGEDITVGRTIVSKGRRLRAQEIGLAASVGRSSLVVYKRLSAAVFSTGDEVRDPGEGAPAGCIFDSNRYLVTALLRGLGCSVSDIGILPDDEAVIAEKLAAAAEDHDLLVTSAGISAGEEDHVKAAVEGHGAINFWRLSIKPGRPIALGQVGDAVFVGLPGNPVAAMVTFMLIARPIVLLLGGATDVATRRFPVSAGFDYKKKAGRREWVRARLETGEGGRLTAAKPHSSGSGILTSMVDADGLVELTEDQTAICAGDEVDYIPFSEVVL